MDLEVLRSIKNRIKQVRGSFPMAEKCVVLIGDTGEGKTTLLNYIANNQLKGVLTSLDNHIIKAVEPSEHMKIGTGPSSETNFPQKWESPEGILFWDCPGFRDTNGLEQDVLNGFNIK
jgi:ABC-type cobalamin/Fe3+-siderophores transport system ATPase subunit